MLRPNCDLEIMLPVEGEKYQVLPMWARGWKPCPLPGFKDSFPEAGSRSKNKRGRGSVNRGTIEPPNTIYAKDIGNKYLEFRFTKKRAVYRLQEGEEEESGPQELRFRGIKNLLINKFSWGPCEAGFFSDFLMQMLRWRPEDRMTPQQIMTHPWLWQPAINRQLATGPNR